MLAKIFSVIALSLICLPLSFASEIQTHQFKIETQYGKTEFEVHYASKNAKLAERVEQIAQNDLIKIIGYFQYSPREIIHINIDPNMRLTNGFARNFPTNMINLYNFPANNTEHLIVLEDFWRGLIIHEFTHIVHLDQTRRFLDTGRDIFGSVAKIPVALVPRWFSEGLAVWSESTLYKSGRLSNALYRKEIWKYLKNPKSCQTLDCIDYSGKYPFGQLSYWIGAAFMEYLENSKAGTIKCLVEYNSGRFPFFLDDAFNNCTNASIYKNYEDFKYSFLRTYDFSNDNGEYIGEAFGATNYQKGILVNKNKIYKVEQIKESEALVMYDFENKINFYNKYSFPISDISGIVKLDEENNGLLISFYDDPNYKVSNKRWKLINDDTLIEEMTLDFDHDPSYVQAINKDLYLTASYENDVWRIRKVKIENNKAINISDIALPNGENITYFRIINSKLIMKYYSYPTDTTRLIAVDFDYQTPQVIYSTKNYFDVFATTDIGLAIKDKTNAYYFNWENNQFFKTVLDYSKIKNTTFSIDSGKYKIALDQDLIVKKDIGFIQTQNRTSFQPEKINYDIFPDSKLNNTAYPELHHFKPHFWFFDFAGDSKVSGTGIQTMLNDPMELHTITLSGRYYTPVNKAGGSFGYTYNGQNQNKKDLNQNIIFDISATRDYSTSDFNSKVTNESTKFDMALSDLIDRKRFHLLPSLLFGTENTKDFISSRKTKYIGIRGLFDYQAMSYDDFVRSFNFVSRLAFDTPNKGDSFTNWQSKLDTFVVIRNDFILEGKLAYGKLFKTDFNRGVLYGGGTNSSLAVRWFEFYGLPYSNAYGNQLYTMKLKLDYDALDYYRGYKLWPAMLKEFHGIVGIEKLNADVIYINNRSFRDESISSIFGGVKFKTVFFYQAPIDIELLYSSISAPLGSRVNAGTFVINGQF